MATLNLRLDPRGVQTGADQAEAALESVAHQAHQTESAVERMATQSGSAVQRFGARAKGVATGGLAAMSRGLGKARDGLTVAKNAGQQFGFQVQDIAVQLGMGVSAIQVFAQQGSQMLGILGPTGAILGAALAVALPLGAAMFSLGKGTKEYGSAVEELVAVSDTYVSASAAHLQSLTDLKEKYGEAAGAARELFEAQANLAKADVKRALAGAVEELTDKFGDLGAVSETSFNLLANKTELILTKSQELRDAQAAGDARRMESLQREIIALGQLPDTIFQVRQEYGATQQEAEQLLLSVRALQTAEGVANQAAAARDMAVALADAVGGVDNIEGEARELYDQLLEAGKAAAEIAGTDTSPGIEAGVDAAARLAQNLSNALAMQNAINRQSSMEYSGRGGDPSRMGDQYTRDVSYVDIQTQIDQFNAAQERAAKKAKSGGSAINQEARELKRFADTIQPTLTLLEEYEAAQIKIEAAARQGIITKQEEAEKLGILQEQYQIASGQIADYAQVADSMAGTLEDGFMSMIDGTMSVQDAFKSMASQIIAELFRVMVVQRMVNGIMGIFGFSPAAGGGFTMGGAAAFGGDVQGGQGVVVGERGPEIFYPATNGTIAPNNSMSGGDVIIHQEINVSTGVVQTVRNEIQTLMPQIAEASKAAVMDARRRGGSFAAAF